ncbi:Uncharacterised protein [Vibrio cholerae]|nr:Uncharacterised protein [Vibrio cholerae]
MAGNTVLYEIFAFKLFHRSVREIKVTTVINELIHQLQLFTGIVFEQMLVVFAFLNHLGDMSEQCRWLVLTVGLFAQVENRKTRSKVLVVGGLF